MNLTNNLFKCYICDKKYVHNTMLIKHINKIHNKEYIIQPNTNNNNSIIQPNNDSIIQPNNDSIIQPNNDLIIQHNTNNNSIIQPNNELQYNNESINFIISNLNEIKNDIKHNYPINNQLLNIICDKNKKIEELLDIVHTKNNQIVPPYNIHCNDTLIINNIEIISRSEDNYINATQMCKAGNKKFNDWYRLESTKLLINEAVTDMKITLPTTHSLLEINKGGNKNQSTWIHPLLAIKLAQWISPKFALQFSKWILQLINTRNIELTQQLQLKDKQIQLLKNTYQKKQKQNRTNYPNNVIYIITNKENIKDRIYIIGKATILKNRLSTYNKSCDHQVIYFRECLNYDDMKLIENMVINKLKIYKEKANVDRFVLPIEHDISLFINIINNCVNFFN